jgi:hypothetical protein
MKSELNSDYQPFARPKPVLTDDILPRCPVTEIVEPVIE